MEPSTELVRKLASSVNGKQLLKLVDRFKKEFEIFTYMSDHAPKSLADEHWLSMLQTRSVDERIKLWEFVALKNQRSERDADKVQAQKEAVISERIDQSERFKAGLMGYGNGMYSLLSNPFAHKKKENELIFDQRQCSSRALKDRPTIALDMQFIPSEKVADRARLRMNCSVLTAENRIYFAHPFPLCYINFNTQNPSVKKVYESMTLLQRHTHPAHFLPECYSDNPFLDRTRKVAYISRHARDILDGPLIHDVYILPLTFDRSKESIGGARSINMVPVSLPFRKYLKWKSGVMYLPASSIQKVLYKVLETGGDWELALKENVSKRHLDDDPEYLARKRYASEIAKQRRREHDRIAESIMEAVS